MALLESARGEGKCAGRRRLHSNAAKAVLMIAAAVLCFSTAGTGQSEEPTEYQVKAAFIYNFAKFVEWPGETFVDRNAPLRVCVLGENPFGKELVRVVSGKKIGGRDLTMSQLAELPAVKGCHILFFSSPERRSTSQILETLRGSSVLTVGESPDFARQGGIIGFVLQEGKVRFEVNLSASEKARVKISSKLLTLARTVYSYPDGKN